MSSNSSASNSWNEHTDSIFIRPLEIVEATKNYSDENLIKQGSSFQVYKGEILYPSGEYFKFVAGVGRQRSFAVTELTYLSNLKHKNIASAYRYSFKYEGFASLPPKHNYWTATLNVPKNDDKIVVMINKPEANGSLDRHLSSPNLTWMQRLHICVGVAHALTYLHHDYSTDEYVLHGNIKSSKILLDENWEPKLHGFAYALQARKHHLKVAKYNGSLQYMDPAYESTGGLTYKSDIFSFGVLLFEVLFGREATVQNDDNWHFARMARSCYEDGKLDDSIDIPGLRNQMSLQSLNIFAETAYWCIKEQRTQRPDTNQICQRLERALQLQRIHEHPTAGVEDKVTSSNNLKGKNLDQLRLKFSDIELATNKFSKAFYIGAGGYGMVYKAELNYFGGIDSSTMDEKNKDELPMKHGTVAIKRLFTREDKQGEKGFVAEIEILSNCKHPNVVSLLGFCDEESELILVYEYVTNGSLADYLGNSDNMINLTWAQRLQICIDIAHGLDYLHAFTDDKPMIVHRDIKSENILLDSNWVAKIADFGLSKLHENQQVTTIVTKHIAGTEVYLDPEYMNTGKLKKESDIYSFGVVMLEILCGRLAYDQLYDKEGLASLARRRFSEGTWKEMVDPKLKETDEAISMLNGGVNQDSLGTFLELVIHCLAKTQSGCPNMEVIIKELDKALNYQINNEDTRHVSLEAIKSGTHNFSDYKCSGKGRFWKLYEGEVELANNGCIPILAKRWDSKSRQGHNQFLRELDTLLKFKHKNIIGFVGYNNTMNEKIIIYEHPSNGRLDNHLDNHNLTWMRRLKICVDVANGLDVLHNGDVNGEGQVVHNGIRSGSILIDHDWNAKISNLELSNISGKYEDDNDFYSLGYIDPTWRVHGILTRCSDIYSLGVILIEMLCGRLAWAEECKDHSDSLGPLAMRHYKEKGNLFGMIFEGIEEQIYPQSLTTFQRIAFECLDDWVDRPKASDVVVQLKKALEFQEDYEIWEPKLPTDYKEIISTSKTPDIYNSIEMKKDLYEMFCKGILLEDNKVCFSLGSNRERNEMISAKTFSYKNHRLRKWRSLPESRFPKVAEVSDLKVHIKIRTQLLSPHVNYKVHLLFKFCGPTKPSQVKRMYVNFKYKIGNKESLNAYFATWRDDGWMMIELFQFLNHKKDTDFEVVLESLSRCYCGSDSIYIEGILFQAFENTILLKEHVPQILLSQIIGQKYEILSAKEVIYNCSSVAVQSRFSGAIELLRQQVLRIKCKVKTQILAPNKETACCLVFQVPEGSCGLCGPVMVRDLFNRRSKETGVVYFRNPNLWNIQDTDWLPKRRLDGWMEVIVWKFKSNYELKDNHLFVNLKLVTYEGTMSGLIVRGIRFRQI